MGGNKKLKKRPRIGLSQRVEVYHNSEIRDCLDRAWVQWLDKLGYEPVLIPNYLPIVIRLLPSLHGCILTGGNDLADVAGARNISHERDTVEIYIINFCANHKRPLLGVCRGMQLLAQHYGATLQPIKGHTSVEHSLVSSDQKTMPLPTDLKVNSFHDFSVISQSWPRESLRIEATAEDKTVEAISHHYYPQWGIMWHPERSPEQLFNDELLQFLFSERDC